MERIEVTISGNLSSSFCQLVVNQATGMGLTGYAREMSNGDIEIVAEGERTDLTALVQYIRTGDSVSDVEAVWESAQGSYNVFEMRH